MEPAIEMEVRLKAVGAPERFKRQVIADVLQIAQAFGLDRLPLITIGGTPRGVDGEMVSCRDTKTATVYVRRKALCASFRFVLAHELAHFWQLMHELPFDEQQADEMAYAVWGHEE